MKGKGHYCAVVLACMGFVMMASVHAEDCGTFQNEGSRRLCIQMDRIEQKLDRALQLLETGNGGNNGGGYGHYYTTSYTCKIRINDKVYQGFGTTVPDAQKDVIAFCQTIGYSSSICATNFTGCDVDTYSQSGHYKCEVKINERIYQGLGTTKADARSMALSVCKQTGYSTNICYTNFNNCYAAPLN